MTWQLEIDEWFGEGIGEGIGKNGHSLYHTDIHHNIRIFIVSLEIVLRPHSVLTSHQFVVLVIQVP